MTPNIPSPLLPPGPVHWLGTDSLGYSVAPIFLEALLRTCAIVSMGALIAALIGTFVGLSIACARSGVARFFASSALNVFSFSTPLLLVLLLVYGLTGSRWQVFPLVAGCLMWGGIALAVESRAAELLSRPFVLAARAYGANLPRIVIRHVLPNLLPTLVASCLGLLAPLLQVLILVSFLGVAGDQATLGSMIRSGYDLFPAAWWLWLPPSLAACVLLGLSARVEHLVIHQQQ